MVQPGRYSADRTNEAFAVNRIRIGCQWVFADIPAGLSCFTAVGLVSSWFGKFYVNQFLLIVVAYLLLVVIQNQRVAPQHSRALPSPWVLSSISFLLLWGIWILSRAGFPIALNRDPGSYLATGLHLSSFNSLTYEVGEHLLFGAGGVNFVGPASYWVSETSIQHQFEHGASVWIATTIEIFGFRWAALSAVVAFAAGLIALGRVMNTIGVPKPCSTALLVSLAISIPVLYSLRSTYSEPFVFALVAIALSKFVWLLRFRESSRIRWASVGLLVGSTCLFRVDGLLYVSAFSVGILFITSQHLSAKSHLWALAGVLPGVSVGTIDHWFFTGGYAADLSKRYWPLAFVTVSAYGLALAAGLLKAQNEREFVVRAAKPRKELALAGAIMSGFGLWYLIFWRPMLHPVKSGMPGLSPSQSLIAGLQQRAGEVVDSSRTYSEYSLMSAWWYLGPVIVLFAIIGYSILVFWTLSGKSFALAALAALTVAFLPYVLKMSIFPDQPWATRRLLPAVYPILTLLAGIGLAQTFRSFGEILPKRFLGVAVAVLTLFPVAVRTLPVHAMTDQSGGGRALEAICILLEEDIDVVVIGSGNIVGAVRGGCATETAFVDDDTRLAVVLSTLRKCDSVQTIGSLPTLRSNPNFEVLQLGQVTESLGSMPFQTLAQPITKLEGERILDLEINRVRLKTCS